MKASSCPLFGPTLVAVTLWGLSIPGASAQWRFTGEGDPAFTSEFGAEGSMAAEALKIRIRHLDLDSPGVVGARLGYRFEATPDLGLQLEAYRLEPHIDEQSPGASGALFGAHPSSFGADNFTAMSFTAHYRLRGLRTGAFPQGRWQPYAGVSVGTAFSDLRGERDLLGAAEETGDEDGLRVELRGRLGSAYLLSRDTALFAQYKFNQRRAFDLDLAESGLELGLRASERTRFEFDLGDDEWHGEFAFHF